MLNISNVYGQNVSLSPLYDVVSTAIYPNLTNKLSMKIGTHYEIDKVTKEDFAVKRIEVIL